MKTRFINRILRQLIPNIGSIIVMAAMLFVYNAHAAALNATSPSVISYQGTLSTAGGVAVNGSTGLTFKLYNAQTGGTVLWAETHTGVPVTNGLFNISLGSITPIPSSVWNNAAVYLGVQVAGDTAELLPREVVSAVPYAMNAAATIVVPDGSITTAKIVDGAVTQAKAPMLLGSTVSNQFIQTGSTQTFNLQPGWNNPVGTTPFPVSFTSVPFVMGVDVSDSMANMPLNIIPTGDTSPQGVAWGIYSGHTSGTRQVVLKWIAVGK